MKFHCVLEPANWNIAYEDLPTCNFLWNQHFADLKPKDLDSSSNIHFASARALKLVEGLGVPQ